MRGFLFDQNLPSRITLHTDFPIVPATNLGRSPTDSEIWQFAEKEEFVIVTKDADFSDRILTRTPPPWVVHLRFGNLRLEEFHAVLLRAWPQIETLLKTHKLVNVYSDRLEGIG